MSAIAPQGTILSMNKVSKLNIKSIAMFPKTPELEISVLVATLKIAVEVIWKISETVNDEKAIISEGQAFFGLYLEKAYITMPSTVYSAIRSNAVLV
jgi:hypothetical protein